jgi:phage antirepressor YoqD-like protein
MEGNIPYQRYLDMGLFKVVENIITINGNDVVKTRTFITGKGQVVLERKYRENGTEVLQ